MNSQGVASRGKFSVLRLQCSSHLRQWYVCGCGGIDLLGSLGCCMRLLWHRWLRVNLCGLWRLGLLLRICVGLEWADWRSGPGLVVAWDFWEEVGQMSRMHHTDSPCYTLIDNSLHQRSRSGVSSGRRLPFIGRL